MKETEDLKIENLQLKDRIKQMKVDEILKMQEFERNYIDKTKGEA